ncbi:hypothetical protein CPC08DRAFT_212273 [Agrocybe pediades]|nr:hypothetical protein CPC08DRAFT_212273 [Agrocybe pediades]
MHCSYNACMGSFTKVQTMRMLESAKAFRRPETNVALPEKKTSTAVSVSSTTATVIAMVSVAASSTVFRRLRLSESPHRRWRAVWCRPRPCPGRPLLRSSRAASAHRAQPWLVPPDGDGDGDEELG